VSFQPAGITPGCCIRSREVVAQPALVDHPALGAAMWRRGPLNE
jgi:hypothetical protein